MRTLGQAKLAPFVPSEVLLDILDLLPSRSLLLLRGISHDFLAAVDFLLRSRLLAITQSETHEMVFESSSPSEYRTTHRQLLQFSHFLDTSSVVSADFAYFGLPANPPVPQFLPLDDDEMFGSYLLSIHIRGIEKPDDPLPESPPTSPPPQSELRLASIPPSTSTTARATPISTYAVGRRAGPSPPSSAPTTPRSTPPRPRAFLSFSISLAEGLERLFRTWFEDPTLEPPLSPSHAHPRRTTPQVLVPSGSCGLLEASIECYQVAPAQPAAGSRSVTYPFLAYGATSYSPGQPRLFEFFYSQLKVEVGKIVVGVEEGLGKGSKRGEVVMWMRV